MEMFSNKSNVFGPLEKLIQRMHNLNNGINRFPITLMMVQATLIQQGLQETPLRLMKPLLQAMRIYFPHYKKIHKKRRRRRRRKNNNLTKNDDAHALPLKGKELKLNSKRLGKFK